MKIRRARREDFPGMREIYLDVRRECFPWLDPASLAPEDFDAETEGEEIWTACVDGRLAGFVTVWVPDRFIHLLFVDRLFQGHQAGTGLLDTVRKIYGTPLTLKCVKKNRRAVDFYLSRGWKIAQEAVCSEGAYYLMRLAEEGQE